MKLKKRIRVYVKSFACLIITSLLVALSACSSTPSASETTPGSDGYTLIAEPSKEQIIGSAEPATGQTTPKHSQKMQRLL